MEQSELVAAFEGGTIAPEDFTHADHVHVAWELAHRYGMEEGLRRLITGIARAAEKAGRPQAYHVTITRAWFLLITGVDDLRSAPELLDKTILSRYYSAERLTEGHDRWVEPDLHPLTLPLPAAADRSVDLAEVFNAVPTAVGVLATRSGDHVHATTVSSITLISLQPALVGVFLANGSRALEHVRRANGFALSVLASDQRDLAERFASRSRPEGAAQFAEVAHHAGEFGPIIEHAAVSLGCRVHALHPIGDHHIVVGEVGSAEGTPAKHPLLRHARTYIRGSKSSLHDDDSLAEQDSANLPS